VVADACPPVFSKTPGHPEKSIPPIGTDGAGSGFRDQGAQQPLSRPKVGVYPSTALSDRLGPTLPRLPLPKAVTCGKMPIPKTGFSLFQDISA
jgi:hypothetical protein